MYRHIEADEGPDEFWGLPHDERSRRLRFFLISRASGEIAIMSWMAALDFTPEIISGVHDLIDVENADDQRIEGLIARGARPTERVIQIVPGFIATVPLDEPS
jgi:hypothetical protein